MNDERAAAGAGDLFGDDLCTGVVEVEQRDLRLLPGEGLGSDSAYAVRSACDDNYAPGEFWIRRHDLISQSESD
jgi:hypothetical protein